VQAIPQPSRLLPLQLAGLIAVFASLAVLALTGAHGAHASTASTSATSQKASAFQTQMRKLWEDHITWTRMVIVDFAGGLPDLTFAEARLLRNQADIGNAIKPYYGAAAGTALTQLLRTHILEAVPVLQDAKAGDKSKLAASLKTWYANGNQIAAFLSKANPASWSLPMMQSMMRIHLDLTANEAVSRLQGKWAADIAAYDAVHREILQMADMLSSGIVAQFPQRFR
jgi:hypothetical protein